MKKKIINNQLKVCCKVLLQNIFQSNKMNITSQMIKIDKVNTFNNKTLLKIWFIITAKLYDLIHTCSTLSHQSTAHKFESLL